MDRRNDQQVHYYVDCGSGSSRTSCFGVRTNGQVHRIGKFKVLPSPGDAEFPSSLCSLLALRSEEHQLRWIAALKAGLAEHPLAPVTIGATAGVRHKMEQGQVSMADAERFFELVRSRLGGREVSCTVLTGEEESRFEFLAVKYCIGLKMPERSAKAAELGMISCGGMSSQLYFKGNAVSLPTVLSLAHSWMLKEGPEKGLMSYKEYLETECGVDLLADQSGLFVGIELLGEPAKLAGFEGKEVSPAEAAKALKARIEVSKEELTNTPKEEFKKMTWQHVSVLTAPVLLLHFVESLHPDSTVLVTRSFEFSESHWLTPNWVLGMCTVKCGLV